MVNCCQLLGWLDYERNWEWLIGLVQIQGTSDSEEEATSCGRGWWKI